MTKINFDVGVIGELNVKGFKNVLVLTGTQYSLDIFEKNIRHLIKANCHVHTCVPAILSDHDVYAVMNYAADKKVDCIISVGVESVMDCGRLVSVLLKQGGYLHEMNSLYITPDVVHHITVPIMPAAGYEISSYASYRCGGEKKMIISPYLVPKATYIDPAIMTNLPSELWAVLGFDCFATSLMAFTSKLANPTSDAYAWQALESYAGFHKKLLKDPSNIEYIKHAASASVNAFLAANYSSTGAVHAIADAIACRFGFRYGIALALVCEEVVKFNYDANRERFDRVFKLIDMKKINLPLPIPKMKDKLAESEIENISKASMNYAMVGNIKKMTEQDVVKILRSLK